MKRLLCTVLTLCFCLMNITGAVAETLYDDEYTDVPSVMTQDSVIEFVADNGCLVEVLQPYDESVALLEELYDFVWNQKNRPVRFYDEQTQDKIQALVPEVGIDSLYMTEYMGLQLTSGDENAESIAMRVELEPDYAPGQLVVAVMGIKGEDGVYSWYPYRGEVPETGVICWNMPEEEFVELTQDKTVLHILTVRYGSGSGEGRYIEWPEAISTPSKSVKDVKRIFKWKSISGVDIDDDFRIFFVDLTQQMQDEMLRMEEFIGEGHAPIEWFPEEIRNEALEMKQGNAALEDMVIYDIAAVMDEEYRDTYGDVATENQFPTSYSADKEMFAILGFWTEDEEFEWYYLRVNGIEDTADVEIAYKQLVLPVMEEEPAMLIVFSEPLIEDDAKE